jgi:hypothetical protein
MDNSTQAIGIYSHPLFQLPKGLVLEFHQKNKKLADKNHLTRAINKKI